MRTIKFRVWVFESDIKEGYMLDIYERFDKDCNSDYYLVYEDFRDLEDGRCKYCIPVQFTGLHVKNGKEIYEGDICKLVKAPNMDFIKDKNPFEVRYGKGAQFYGYVDGWLEDVHLYDLENYEYEILGNIYENPELISKTPTHEH